jgi:hypothetical protein
MIQDKSQPRALGGLTGRIIVLERYRTLGAALALGEFTVPEVARLSGVRESTVRTTLRREGSFVERIGTQKIGRRGGQPVRWRVRPKARERLRAQLRELEQLGVGPWLGEREDESNTLPAGIIAAEDVLIRLAPMASDPTRRTELVDLAQAQLDAATASALSTGNVPGDADVQLFSTHQRLVEQLIELERTERNEQLANGPQGQQVYRDVLVLADELYDESLTEAVRGRLRQSPIQQARPPGARKALFGHVGGPDPRMVSEMRRLQQRVKDLEAELVRLQEENEALAVEADSDAMVPGLETIRAAERVASEILTAADRFEELLSMGGAQ